MTRKWHLSLVVVCLALGLLLATSYSAQEKARILSQTPRKQELIARIRQLEKDRDAEKEKIDSLRGQLSDRQERAAASAGVLEDYNRGLDMLKFRAGLTKAIGPGLRVTIGDNPEPPTGDANNYIVHDYDIRQIVNALWAGGAEAVAINGQRLVGTTAIRCAGSTILVNSTRLASPFVISAVGNQGDMEKSLRETKEASDFLNKVSKAFGLIATVERASSLTLPLYEGSVYFKESNVLEGVK